MIGIQLAGKKDRIPAAVFVRSLNSFLELLSDVDSMLSKQSKGSVRWELVSLQKASPALIEFGGVSRIEAMDYSGAIQDSVLEGIEQLSDRPEQPQFYSYSAMVRTRAMAEQAKHLDWMTIFSGGRKVLLDRRISNNIEYLLGEGSKSLGSLRGSLDALMVHSGHEFRIWSTKWPRPIVCRFKRDMLQLVLSHIKQQVEVIGEIQRNAKGEPVVMNVHELVPMEAVTTSPTIEEMSGIVPNLYGGDSLRNYLDELRNG